MPVEQLLSYVPVFVLVLFRISGVMLFAPLFGSTRIPKRAKALFAIILAMALTGSVKPPAALPATSVAVAVAIGGEICFGLAMGMILSFVFIAAQWAGEIVGQQMGFNLAETFDPMFAQSSSLIGDMYYMMTLVIFLSIGGHRQLIRGIHDSFDSLPLLSVGIDRSVLDLTMRMFETVPVIAIRLAAPVLTTMLLVDVTLGFLGKTMPQMNVMTMGLSIKAMVGLVVLLLGISLFSTSNVLEAAMNHSIHTVRLVWAGGAAR